MEARDWVQFRRAIESARSFSQEGDDSDILALEANQLAIAGDIAKAREMLTQALEEFPNSFSIRRALALLYAKQNEVDSALDIVNDLVVDKDRELELIFLKAELLFAADRFEEARELLNESIAETEVEATKVELQIELAKIEIQLGNWDFATEILNGMSAESRETLRVIEMQGRLAWCQQDWDRLEECERRLQEIEGSRGALWRTCRIRRILGRNADARHNQALLDDCNLLGETASSAPPKSTCHPHFVGARGDFAGLLWEAVANYERAWDLGVPRMSMAVDLIGLLNELGQTQRAQRYVDEARSYMKASRQLIDRSVVDFVHDTDDDAIRFAEAWVRDHPDSEGYLRYGAR